MLLNNKELYEFGEFRLNVGEHTLTRSDGSKNGQLPEKAFQTLIILVRFLVAPIVSYLCLI